MVAARAASRPVGPWLDHVVGVGGRPVAQQLGVGDGAAPLRDLGGSRTRSAAPSPMTNPSRADVERPRRAARVVVVAGRQRADDVEGAERERAQRDLAAARDRGIDPPLAQVAERLAQRDRARRARVGGRQDRPADVERDAEVGRGRAAEDRQREVGRHLADPALEVARRAAPRHRRCRRAPSRDRSRSVPGLPPPSTPGVIPASSSASRPATSPNWLNRSSWRAVFGGIQASGSKSSTWAATCERNGLGSKRSIRLTGERPARSPARNASRPVPIGVMMPIPVIQIRRARRPLIRRPGGRSASASASALNVASVRPAIGRVNQRSTSLAKPGRRGRKSWSIETRQPVAVGSIRQVTSIPFVGPATWTNRSRSVSGSFQVRAGQTTGRPSPRTPMSGRRATKSTMSEPSGRRSTTRDRA